jgi:hypothetical protein
MAMTVAGRLCGHLGIPTGPLAITPAIYDGPSTVREYRSGAFTGPGFDTYGVGRFDPCAITGDDLIAVSMLSIGVSTRQKGDLTPDAILKIEPKAAEVRRLLEAMPIDRDLHSLNESEFENLMGTGSPGEELYLLLRRAIGFPRVPTHKLMARKRPRLAPVRDSVTEGMLGLSRSPAWWRPWWEALTTEPRIPDRLASIRLASDAADLSLLRIADIVLWMKGTAGKRRTSRSAPTGIWEDSTGEP